MVICIILADRLSEGVHAVLYFVRGYPQVLRVANVLHLTVLTFQQTLYGIFVSSASDDFAMQTISDIVFII